MGATLIGAALSRYDADFRGRALYSCPNIHWCPLTASAAGDGIPTERQDFREPRQSHYLIAENWVRFEKSVQMSAITELRERSIYETNPICSANLVNRPNQQANLLPESRLRRDA